MDENPYKAPVEQCDKAGIVLWRGALSLAWLVVLVPGFFAAVAFGEKYFGTTGCAVACWAVISGASTILKDRHVR
jgi:hypothetical protein